MTSLKPVLGASALALFVSAPMALAEVSAADVWAQWQDYSARSGLVVSAEGESTSGTTLTLTGVRMVYDSTEVAYSAEIDELVFTGNGDGTVSVTVPASYPLTLRLRLEDGEQVTASLAISQTGLDMRVSGSPDAMSHSYAAESLSLALTGLSGAETEGLTAAAEFTLNDVTGSYEFGSGALMPFASTLSAGTIAALVDVIAPDDEGAFSFALNAASLGASSDGALPAGIDTNDVAAMLAAGFSVAGGMELGEADYAFSYKGPWDSSDIAVKAASSGVSFAMSADGMSYRTDAAGVDVSLKSGDMPFEQLTLKLAETAFGLGMPIARSDEPQDISFLTRLVGLEIDEQLWSLIDAAGQLPRDPMTLIIDAAGKANWLVDLLAEDAEAQMMSGMPGQLHALDLRALELTAVGASLTGTGAFTFDNDDLMTWGGVPAPDGKLDLKLVGANKLIDTLVTLGIVPQDQAMMARMGMGMFARPGEGPDTLVSTIEVRKDGSVFANGQQLQ